MKKYKDNFISFFKWPIFIPVILTTISSYFYLLTHSTVNIDTLSYDRYYYGVSQLANGRYLGFLLNKLTNLVDYNPFFADFWAIILMIIAALICCAFIKMITKDKVKEICYTVFICLFVSYPLFTEILSYVPSGINIGLGYITVFLASIFTYEGIINRQKKYIAWSTILLLISITLYESFASVYLLCISLIVLYEELIEKVKTPVKNLFKKYCTYLIPVLISVIMNVVITKILKTLIVDPNCGLAGKSIYYDFSNMVGSIIFLIKAMVYRFIYMGTYNISISILVFCLLIFIGFSISKFIKTKNSNILLLGIAVVLSLFSLSIIQGTAADYRTCQTFGLFTSIIVIYLLSTIINGNKSKIFENTFIVLSFVLVFYQSKAIHKWAYLNNVRYEYEKNVLINISEDLLENYDTSKPLVFIGEFNSPSVVKKFMFNKNGKRIGQSDLNSYIKWGLYAFDTPGEEIVKFCYLLGYDFKSGTWDMKKEAEQQSEFMEKYPKKGYIKETNNYIIINF